jgi:hypothetical protein
MTGTAARVVRLTTLWLLAAALAPVGWTSIAAANTGHEKTQRPPTLLWRSYPLEQRPSTTEQLQAVLGNWQAAPARSPGPTRQAAPTRSTEVQPPQDLLLVSAFLATLAAMAAIVLMQTSLPARVGGFRRARDGARIREPARRTHDPMPPRRTRPPRQVTGQPVADPHAQPTQPAVSEPGDELLEALHPKPPSAPEPEPVPEQAVERREWEPEQDRTRELPLELQLRRLVERMQTAPGPEREQLEREIELLHGQTTATPPAELEPSRDQAPRTFSHAMHAVPEPDPKGTIEGWPPPHRRGARQPRASVESCDIRLWRGYVKCQLYATIRGSDEALAVSRHFRLRDKDAPSASAQRALADLLAELERRGWTVVLDGPIWYQHRLQWAAVATHFEGQEMGPPGLDQ